MAPTHRNAITQRKGPKRPPHAFQPTNQPNKGGRGKRRRTLPLPPARGIGEFGALRAGQVDEREDGGPQGAHALPVAGVREGGKEGGREGGRVRENRTGRHDGAGRCLVVDDAGSGGKGRAAHARTHACTHRGQLSMRRRKMVWEREDSAFRSVAPTCRCSSPCAMRARACLG